MKSVRINSNALRHLSGTIVPIRLTSLSAVERAEDACIALGAIRVVQLVVKSDEFYEYEYSLCWVPQQRLHLEMLYTLMEKRYSGSFERPSKKYDGCLC